MTPAPRTALAIQFSLAVGVALAVLVPATMSYGMPLFPTPIDNLTFNAGRVIDASTDPSFITTLDTNDLWKKTSTDKVEPYLEYTSVTGTCEVRLHENRVPDAVPRVNGDKGTTEAYINYIFPDAEKGSLTNLPTDTTLNYRTVDSGKTVDGLVVSGNEVSKMIFRAFTVSSTVLIVEIACVDASEEAAALTEDVFLHTAVIGE